MMDFAVLMAGLPQVMEQVPALVSKAEDAATDLKRIADALEGIRNLFADYMNYYQQVIVAAAEMQDASMAEHRPE